MRRLPSARTARGLLYGVLPTLPLLSAASLLLFICQTLTLSLLRVVPLFLPRFVRFSASFEAQSAIKGMDGHRVGAKRLLCKLANSPKEKEAIPVNPGKASSDEPPRQTNKKPTLRHASYPILPQASSSYAPNPPRDPVLRPTSSPPAPLRTSTSSILQVKQPSTNLYIKSLLPNDTEGTPRLAQHLCHAICSIRSQFPSYH